MLPRAELGRVLRGDVPSASSMEGKHHPEGPGPTLSHRAKGGMLSPRGWGFSSETGGKKMVF